MDGDDRTLGAIYYGLVETDKEGAFSGFQAFWKAVKRRLPGLSQKKAKKWYDSQRIVQLNRPVRRPPVYRNYLVSGLGKWMSIDNLTVGKRWGPNRYTQAYTGKIHIALSQQCAKYYRDRLIFSSRSNPLHK